MIFKYTTNSQKIAGMIMVKLAIRFGTQSTLHNTSSGYLVKAELHPDFKACDVEFYVDGLVSGMEVNSGSTND